jgi:hypothetical protein
MEDQQIGRGGESTTRWPVGFAANFRPMPRTAQAAGTPHKTVTQYNTIMPAFFIYAARRGCLATRRGLSRPLAAATD